MLALLLGAGLSLQAGAQSGAGVKALVNDRDILVKPGGMVEYFHILLDQHEVIFANGTAAESLYLGEQALRGLPPAARQEITTLFPELEQGGIPDAARPLLTVRQGREWAKAARSA